MSETIRIGKISSIDYSNGMVRVVYSDKNDAVTASLPYLSNGEYKMPDLGDMVLVAHLSNGAANGICLGTIWNTSNAPTQSGKGVYSKHLSSGCSIKCSNGLMAFTTSAGTITVATMLSMYSRIGNLENTVSSLSSKIIALEEAVTALGG